MNLAAVGNHLWQSTIFTAVARLLVHVLQKNSPRVRYSTWMLASIKFLVPLSLLITLGSHLSWPANRYVAGVNVPVIEFVGLPFGPGPSEQEPAARAVARDAPKPSTSNRLVPEALLAIWLLGAAAVMTSWLIRMRRVQEILGTARVLEDGREIEALERAAMAMRLKGFNRRIRCATTESVIEPGVHGIFRPILLLPSGVTERLETCQLDAIVDHELCHIRRYDNLFTLIHTAVEAIFWFHPLVWWIGTQLLDERERACDEQVLENGGDPKVYASAILKVCEFYIASPLECVAGVSGGNITRRIEEIMNHCIVRKLTVGRKLLLFSAGAMALIIPLVVGMLHAPPLQAQSQTLGSAPQTKPLTFGAASAKPASLPDGAIIIDGKVAVRRKDGPGVSVVDNWGGPGTADPVRIHYPLIVLKDLLGRAYDSFGEIRGPGWLDSDLVQIDATIPPGTTMEQFKEMLRNLIAERFGLRYHVETKGGPAEYALVVAKNGPRMKVSTDVSPPSTGNNTVAESSSRARQIGPDGFPISANPFPGASGVDIGQISGNRHRVVAWQLTMKEFASDLAKVFKIGIVDATGLKAKYDFTMFFGAGPDDRNAPPDPQDFPDIFSALQSQLGLRLEAKKMQAEVMVIDHMEKEPSGN